MENTLNIIYGSRTGNSRSIALAAEKYAKHVGLDTNLHEMKSMDFSLINKIKYLLLIVSTHGEGDPPAVAMEFYNYIHQDLNESLDNMKFCVLALGDSSYKDYCKTGKDIHKRFLQLGAESISPVQECDVDFEDTARLWIKDLVGKSHKLIIGSKVPKVNFTFNFYENGSSTNGIFQATIMEKRNLCSNESTKQTLHLALSMEENQKEFEPGDSLAVICPNSRLLVDRLLKQMNLDGTHGIQENGQVELLKQVLLNKYELSLLTPVVLKKYASVVNRGDLNKLIQDPDIVNEYCAIHDVLDMVTDYPAPLKATEFLTVLRKLKPRLYSIASSSKTYPNEVHITLGLMKYDLNNREHIGVTSSFLSDRIEKGERLSVYFESNDSFRLPTDPESSIIMIACGTGIAPYRAFLQEREESNAKGDNWLIFGERSSEHDFLYRDEMIDFQKRNVLTRFNTAFSRDQSEKIYVEDVILNSASEIYRWIHECNATLYICGNKRTMAVGVRDALKEVISKEGNFSASQSQDYINQLKKDNRWQEDVY